MLRILTVQKLWGFNFLQGLPPDLFDGFSIGRYKQKCESFDLIDAKFKSKVMHAPALEPFQNKDTSLVLLLSETVNGVLKILQNCSKTVFEAKGRQYTTGKVIQRLFDIDL